MALQVWLPLNGDLHNQGLKQYNLSMFRGSEVYNNNGKIGKCFYANGVNTIKILNIIPDFYNYSAYSLCAWIYIEAQNTSHSGCGIVSAGNWNSQVLNLGLSDWSTNHYTRLRISGTNWSRTYAYNFSLNTWYHIVVSSDSNKTYAYVNGVLIGDSQTSFLPTSIEGDDICIGGATYYSGMQFFGRINDVRIYNHCLSKREVEEIFKGLVLHYQLNNGNPNLLSEYVTPGQGAPGATSTGGRTNYYGKYGIIIPATENADTYFRLFLKQQLVQGTTYTISCYVSGLLPGSYYNFPLFAQGNTSMGILQLNHNGLCSLTFTMNSSSQSAVTTPEGDTVYVCFMDDAGRTLASGQGAVTINGFKLEQGNNVTNFFSIDNNIIYDASGYNNNGTINDTTVTSVNISSKYLNCIKNSQANNSATYLAKGNINMPESSTLTFSWWMNPSTIGVQTSGIFSTSASNLPTDYSTTAANMRDSCFDCCNTSGTCVRINVESYLTLNEWHHYVLTYNGSKLIFYKDGVQKTTVNQTGNLKSFTSIFLFYSKAGGLNRTTSGLLSDVRIYVTALTPAQIKELYETSKIVDGTTVKARDLEVST